MPCRARCSGSSISTSALPSRHTAALRSSSSVASPICGRRTSPPTGSREPVGRSEEHTSELQSHLNLVCRLLLEKKKIGVLFHLCSHPDQSRSSLEVVPSCSARA